MKKLLLILVILEHSFLVPAQEIPVASEQQLENLADVEQVETEDDNWLQELEQFRKFPIDVNTAGADELARLRMLSALQIENLVRYRNLLGKLVSLYELQAIPGWDIPLIKRVIPYISITSALTVKEDWQKRFSQGDQQLLLRVSHVLERSVGFDKTIVNGYTGSPQRIMFRYKYAYKNLLQFGLLGDKDAGEQFFSGAQRKGFDFYSVHFFARKTGIVQSLALGDFTVNMGQGLIQWQGLAFRKSAEVMNIKRQSEILRPYHSPGEFFFYRGAGITVQKRRISATFFASLRKLDANKRVDTTGEFLSSFLSSGYHRTNNELSDRNTLSQTSAGASIRYRSAHWQAGVNAVYHRFSLLLQKNAEPYDMYGISGTGWYNISADYSYQYKNLHCFGEFAVDRYFNPAFLNGMLISVDPRVDISLLHRRLSASYQALYGNAFTENSQPGNESGLYMGASIRPATGWRIDAYADMFRFPWLKYRVDAPGHGTDLLVQLTYMPNRQTELYTRYRSESKQGNQPGNEGATNYLVFLPRQSWRTQLNLQLNTAVTIRTRFELLWYDRTGANEESGFLFFMDILYKPSMKPFASGLRLQYFETEGYNSRIYAYENDVLFSYTVPANFDKGYRFYINGSYDLDKKTSFWIRLARTIHPGKSILGSGLDEIRGPARTELKIQVRVIF